MTFILILLFLKIEHKRTPMSLKTRIMQLDPLGAVMLLASVVCLLLALQWGGQAHAWNSATIIGLLVGSGLLFIVFAFVQWRMGEDATIPLRVLKLRSILCASAFLFFIAMSNYVVSFPNLCMRLTIADTLLVWLLHSNLLSIHQRLLRNKERP